MLGSPMLLWVWIEAKREVPTLCCSSCWYGMCIVVRGSLNFFARPKSITLITEDDLSTPMTKFAGLTSLWTKSREWMNSIRSSWERERSAPPKKEAPPG